MVVTADSARSLLTTRTAAAAMACRTWALRSCQDSRRLDEKPLRQPTFARKSLRLLGTLRETPSGEFVFSLLGEFKVQGPSGLHRCIFTELLGPVVKAVEEFSGNAGLLPLQTGCHTIVQYANRLPFLHFQFVYLALSEHGAD